MAGPLALLLKVGLDIAGVKAGVGAITTQAKSMKTVLDHAASGFARKTISGVESFVGGIGGGGGQGVASSAASLIGGALPGALTNFLNKGGGALGGVGGAIAGPYAAQVVKGMRGYAQGIEAQAAAVGQVGNMAGDFAALGAGLSDKQISQFLQVKAAQEEARQAAIARTNDLSGNADFMLRFIANGTRAAINR
jgi:hypothetical protein